MFSIHLKFLEKNVLTKFNKWKEMKMYYKFM